MRLPTQILLLGAILTNSARANETAPDVPATPTPDAPAPAPGAEPVVRLEPVIVTADIWETPLEKISASVSVYDGAELAGEGVRHFGDLANQVPNLTYTGGTSRPRYFQIRGVGENSQFEGEAPDSTVRFLVDDLDFTGIGTVGGTFDVRQVEVLRGPQAGAFGANAAGGVVRLVTNDPTPVWTGAVESSVGTEGLFEGGFAVGGPLIESNPEKLMFRFSLHQHVSDGYLHNAFLDEDTNERDELMSRLKLTWNPSAVWRWDTTVFYADVDNGYDQFALDNNGRYTYSDEPGEDLQVSIAGSVRGVYSGWQDVRFTTVTTGAWTDSTYSYDSDWNSVYTHPDAYKSFLEIVRDRAATSQEFRFDSVDQEDALGWVDRWTLGAYVSRLDEESAYSTDAVTQAASDYVADNYALFGQMAHDFTGRTRAILGLRGEYVDQHSRVDGDGSGTVDFRPQFDDSLVGGKLTLEHDLTARHTGFVSVARGYKAGGVSVDANIDPSVDPLTFETEDLWNYEAGLRGHWFDQRLFGELTYFYLERSNTQLRGSVGDTDDYRYYTINGEDASVHGLESSLKYRFTKAWSAYGSLGLMRSQRDAFALPNGSVADERELAATPAYGYTVRLRYREPRDGWFGNVELVGRDEYYESESSDETRSAFQVVNASLGYAWREWTFSVWARNLLDEEYEQRVFFFGNDPTNGYAATRYESRADPRQLGVSARYDF
ncbi:MAG: TonB-dependent receptor [Burkholderiales bacterium]|nr:TonB-dependent receptor [Opitutaceae bacterium]